MSGEAKKLHLIEQLLKVTNESVLKEVETALSKEKLYLPGRKSFKDFSNLLSDVELAEFEEAIENGCEQIDKNEWK